MKKLGVVLLVILVVSLFGCETTSQVAQDVGIIAQRVCNFDVATSQEAQAAGAFISIATAVVGPFVGVKMTAGEALAVFNTIANAATTGACVFLEDMQDALDFFNALSTRYKEVQMMKGKRAIEIPSLLNLNAKLSAEKRMRMGK